MKVNLLDPIEAFDADGTLIMGKEGKPPSIKEMVVFALRSAHQSDNQSGFKEKNERYLVIKRINAADEIDFTDGEIKMILDRCGKLFLQVELVGRIAELLTVAKPAISAVRLLEPDVQVYPKPDIP